MNIIKIDCEYNFRFVGILVNSNNQGSDNLRMLCIMTYAESRMFITMLNLACLLMYQYKRGLLSQEHSHVIPTIMAESDLHVLFYALKW